MSNEKPWWDKPESEDSGWGHPGATAGDGDPYRSQAAPPEPSSQGWPAAGRPTEAFPAQPDPATQVVAAPAAPQFPPNPSPAGGYPATPPGYAAVDPRYGYPPAAGWVPPPPATGLAQGVLWTGIGSLVVLVLSAGLLGWVPAIVALVMAPAARRGVAAAQGRARGQGHVTAGVICSWVSIGLTVLTVVGIVLALVAWGSMFGLLGWAEQQGQGPTVNV